ncbi:hypothetical protein OK074_5129 [Actinobacteria bacterium OK074]|nr:hypothetical protein OK074_5129 [Actinobacteria bacterium OK074]
MSDDDAARTTAEPAHHDVPAPRAPDSRHGPAVSSGHGRLFGALLLGAAAAAPYLGSAVSPPVMRIAELPYVRTLQTAGPAQPSPRSALPPATQVKT